MSEVQKRGTEWYDRKADQWVSAGGYPVCQDHGGPADECRHCARQKAQRRRRP